MSSNTFAFCFNTHNEVFGEYLFTVRDMWEIIIYVEEMLIHVELRSSDYPARNCFSPMTEVNRIHDK